MEADTSRKEVVVSVTTNRGEKTMQALDPTIAYYLCGIMVVLALVIAIGANRKQSEQKKNQQKE